MISYTEFLTLPLFPLGTTLYPDGVIHLKIFEVRYLDMIKTCIKDQVPFGIVTLDQGGEVRTPNEKISFARVGTFANIEHFDAIQPSLFVVKCTGGARFTIRGCERKKNGLWVADVEAMDDDLKMTIPSELKSAAQTLKKVIDSMAAQGVPKDQMPFTYPHLLNDCGWVANRWCELLPLSAGQREHLLGLANPRLRLDLVFDVLDEMGISNVHNNS
jgi:Lon protease-like protein